MEFTGTKINSFKNELLMAIQDPKVPAEIRQAVMKGDLKIVDAAIYSAKVLDKTSKELMVASDNKKEGLTNINNRKLEATNYFLLGVPLIQGFVRIHGLAPRQAEGNRLAPDSAVVNHTMKPVKS